MQDALDKAHEEWEKAFLGKVVPLWKQANASSDTWEYLTLRAKADHLDKKITDKLFKFHERYVRSL